MAWGEMCWAKERNVPGLFPEIAGHMAAPLREEAIVHGTCTGTQPAQPHVIEQARVNILESTLGSASVESRDKNDAR